MSFIRDFNEKIDGLTDSSFISDVLIMDDLNYNIRERQEYKPRLFDVRKNCYSDGCNSAEYSSSEGKRCKAEENKYMGICEINNLEILNWNFVSAGRREFTFINNSEFETFQQLKKCSMEVGLKINEEKNKYLKCSKKDTNN